LLGLGMMAVLEDSLELIRNHYDEDVDLAHLPAGDPDVYSTLQKADTIGMFQIESRAQMSCLPRLRPQRFYDIVVQVAIIRPGPIVGQMVNPYLQRRQGREKVTYAHPSLEPVLERTLGVPLFQEQLLRMAMVVAGFSGGEGEELRRAMGFYRPATIVKDAQRHGLKVLPVDVMKSEWKCTVVNSVVGYVPLDVGQKAERPALRLGLRYVRGLREEASQALVRERNQTPFTSIHDLVHRVPELRKDELNTLAEIGALNSVLSSQL